MWHVYTIKAGKFYELVGAFRWKSDAAAAARNEQLPTKIVWRDYE